MQTSKIQARWLSRYAATLTYVLEPGPSDAIRFPEEGPFDRRLGYVALPDHIARLTERGYEVQAQARFSPALLSYADHGFFVPYAERSQVGLTIHDCRGEPLYANRYPHQFYARFEDIPPLVSLSLMFIEDRGLLDLQRPHANPAVDWPRFAKAALSQL